MTLRTPFGETCDLDDIVSVAIDKHVPMSTPVVIRVIEREAIIEIVDGEPEDFDRLRIHAPSETHTYVLDPEDIEYIDGIVYLVVGDRTEEDPDVPTPGH